MHNVDFLILHAPPKLDRHFVDQAILQTAVLEAIDIRILRDTLNGTWQNAKFTLADMTRLLLVFRTYDEMHSAVQDATDRISTLSAFLNWIENIPYIPAKTEDDNL